MTSPGIPPLSRAVLEEVASDLRPPVWRVFGKLAAIYAMTAVLTLSVCPQFGVRLLGEGMGLMHSFMALGTYGCQIACGAFFVGSGVLLASMLLRGEELAQIRRHGWLVLGILISMSLGVFVMVDATVVVAIAAAWCVGAFLAGFGALEAAWTLRFRPSM